MGVMYKYFAAESDERAAATVDRLGGPGGDMPVSPEWQEAVRARDPEALRRLMRPRVRLSENGLYVLSVKGVDPLQMATLEELLTGVDGEVVEARPRSGMEVAWRDDGELMVLTLTDELRDALAEATPTRLDTVAVPWSRMEEDWDQDDLEGVTQFLHELSQLARHARDNGHGLYCWVCV